MNASASVFIVNAEADSMAGVVEGGVGVANRTSLPKVIIQKVQAELRQECGIRDERKRELEFLEEGGNPLDFKLEFGATVSIQSTSITDQHPNQFVASEAKGSFELTASPHGDSFESSGRPGTTPWESNSADNLMLFDAEHESSEGGRSLLRKSNVVPSEQSFQTTGGCRTLEHVDSAVFDVPRKAYKRRYRSRRNRDGTRSNSTDVNSALASLPSRHGLKDVKGLICVAEQKNTLLKWNSNSASPTKEILHESKFTDGQDDIVLDSLKSFRSTNDKRTGVSVGTTSDEHLNQLPVSAAEEALKQVESNLPKATQVESNLPKAIQVERVSSAVTECQPSMNVVKIGNQSTYQMNGFSRKSLDDVMTDARNTTASCGTKVENHSSKQVNLHVDRNNDSEMHTIVRNVQDVTAVTGSDKFANKKKDTRGMNSSSLEIKESDSAFDIQQDNDVLLQSDKKLDKIETTLEIKVNDQIIVKGKERTELTQMESGKIPADPLADIPGLQNEISPDVRHKDSSAVSLNLPEGGSCTRVSTDTLEAQTYSSLDSMPARKVDEDSILEEAQTIEAKRKRMKELSDVPSPVEIFQKFHWDYVLKEVMWLANDFAQERIWKVAAASQISHRAAVACQLRMKEKNSGTNTKRIAHTLAKAVLQFWHNIEFQVQEKSQELELQRRNNGALSVQAYAVRFLKCNKQNIFISQAEVPLTPELVSDSGITDLSWVDNLTEDNLFYTIPDGAMETYRMAIESHVAHSEGIGRAMQEEVETSAFYAAADFSEDDACGEDEGEANTYNMSRYGQRKHKHLTYPFGARSYEMDADLLLEKNLANPHFVLLSKRPGSDNNVSIPTKRVRTAIRRVINPFGAGASACIQVPNTTDASSCDTNSFQDDQNTFRGRFVPNSVEVNSAGEFEKQVPFDSAEVSTIPKKKKKKRKHPNDAYEQRWQVDSSFQNEQFQRDYMQKRSESQLESKGNSELLGQPIAKRPKFMRHHDNTNDNIRPSGGSVASPVGSQISNMSKPNKVIKMLGGRDRGRKAKALKMSSGQPGSGSLWTSFEDQALVVLAHDLGPNWELVSDAFNSILQFKCVFRKSKDCKDRHIFLMDKTPGDGADSAEDSGSSQPYPSTLPGIPKGSARQLLQRLQGPVEEEALKIHFEKIIIIGQKQHYRKTQDPKQFQQPHSSHAIALSQVCPNNLSGGGSVLTPLDLITDVPFNGPEAISLEYQGAHSSGLPIQNHSTTDALPASGASSAPVSSNMIISNSFPSSPCPLNSSARVVRPVAPKSGSLSADDHHRVRLYSQVIPGARNVNAVSPASLSGGDRGVRLLPSGSGMGIMSGVNRSMPMARSGFQGIPASSSGVSSPSMASPNTHGAAQGSSIVRPCEVSPMTRPGPTHDSQMLNQAAAHFGGVSSPFPNQTVSPPAASYPLHHQPISPRQHHVLQSHFQGPANQAPTPQQQAQAMRLAKEKHMKQRLLQKQQQYAQPQLPAQNTSQVQPQMSAMQQKHPTQTQGVSRNAQAGGTNPMGKQRQLTQHQFSQVNRQHPQHRQQLQPKGVKGGGRGNLTMHQNNDSLSNGVSTNPGNQCLEKGEPPTTSGQAQGLYLGTTQNSFQSTRQYAAPQLNQTPPQQKMYSSQSSLKHSQQTVNSNQGPVPSVTGSNTEMMAQQNPQIHSGPSVKQDKKADADLNPPSRSAQIDKMTTLTHASNNTSNAVQVASQPSVQNWHSSEPLLKTNALETSTNLNEMASRSSNLSESVSHSGQGHGQRLLTNSPLTRHDVSAQRQQHQHSQVQLPPPASQPL